MGLLASLSLVRDVSAIVRNIGYEQELLITDYDIRFLLDNPACCPAAILNYTFQDRHEHMLPIAGKASTVPKTA
jgi:hypothetical protein